MVVIGRERRPDAVALEQPGGDAGVLAGDEVGGRQRLERPQRDIAEIPDRGGDQIEPGRQRAGRHFVSRHHIAAGPPVRRDLFRLPGAVIHGPL